MFSSMNLLVSLALLASGKADIYGCVTDDKLNVTFGGYEVDCGTVMPYSTAHYYNEPPVIKYTNANASYFTVAMIDPDAPNASDPTYREVRHYLVGNVPKEILQTVGVFNNASILSAFVNPSPPEDSGYHRYVQFVYEQPDSVIDFDPVDDSITNFNITAFAETYDLTLVASNYFKTQYECSSDYTQCGVTSDLVDCCTESFGCFEQNDFYYQCLPACPADPSWQCNQSTLLAS